MTCPRSSILGTAFLLIMAPSLSHGFVSTMSSLQLKELQRTPPVQSSVSNGNLDDLEEARRRFEASIRPHHVAVDGDTSTESTSPLTASSRRRRVIEMDLLDSLRDSDDAIDELVTLWMVERGLEGMQRFRAMEQSCSDGLIAEEAMLRTMIVDYPEWSEPACRLAAVLYYQGQSQESMEWTDRVLHVKPWHFEAVQLQILNCLRLHDCLHHHQNIWTFARQALPPLNPSTNHAARQRWTDLAMRDAQRSLDQADEAHRGLSHDGILKEDEQQHMWQ